MNLKLVVISAIIAKLIVTPMEAHGLSGDADQPLHIEADSAEANDITGVIVYRGEVRVTQGSMILTGDVVTVVAPDRLLKKITAEGDLSTFQQLTDDGKQIDAEAEYMEYDAPANKLMLLRKARMQQGQNSFASERIEYYVDTKVVDAGDPENGNRVRMTIIPEILKSNP